MKKIIWPLLLCAVLCGCGGAEAETGNAVQEQYRTLETARLEAEVTSHTSTDSRTFTLLCSYDADGDAVTTVTAPSELAGLTAVVSGADMTLSSEGLQLPAGASLDICPANCLPYLLRALADGYVLEQSSEVLDDTPCLRLALDTTAPGGGKVLCAVWLDAEGLFPRYAEFSRNEQVVLTVKLLAFTCTTSEG